MKHLIRILCLTLLLVAIGGAALAQQEADGARGFGPPAPDRPVGVLMDTGEVADGYVLVTMIQTKDVLLMSNDGRVVNKWAGDHYTGAAAYLLENGNLLRTASLDENFDFGFNGQWGFMGGRIEERDWDNNLVWEFEYATERFMLHHDITVKPDGNVLALAFERFSQEEAVAAGFNPEQLVETHDFELYSEKIIEIDPSTNEIVWEWRLADHFVQDFNPDADNFGVVADHPGRVDINYYDPVQPFEPNWFHVNTIDYNADLDLIAVSPRRYNEIWFIDRNTTAEEASDEAGELVYRWGNPQTHDAGTEEDRLLWFQHDSRWIPEGYPGAGNMMIFNNGGVERLYSSVIELDLPEELSLEPGVAPDISFTEWFAPDDMVFYSSLMSGAQRLPNGNTLITEGLTGHIFEYNADGEIVWRLNMPPAVWVFQADRYDLPVFDELDTSGDLGFEGGEVWGIDCVDGEQPRLYEYLISDNPTFGEFAETWGDDARGRWELEACVENGGVDSSAPADGPVWGQNCADGEQPRLHYAIAADSEAIALFLDTFEDEAEAQLQWETQACEAFGGIADS